MGWSKSREYLIMLDEMFADIKVKPYLCLYVYSYVCLSSYDPEWSEKLP